MDFETHYQKNRQALQEHHYELSEKISRFLEKHPSFERERMERFLKLPKAYYDPQTPSQNLFLDLKNVLWLGVGLGKKIPEHLLSPKGLGQSHIIIEPSLEDFCFFLMLPGVEALLARKDVFWIVDVPLESLPIHYRKISQSPLLIELTTGPSNIVKISGYQEDYLGKAVDLWNAFFSVTASSSSICSMDEYFGFHNSMTNLSSLLQAPFLSAFKNCFKGLPGIVVSSGPSLNVTLPLLKGLEGKAVIYCSDSSFKILKQNGITPHFVGCFERTILTDRFLKDASTDPTFLIATSVVHKNVIDAFPNRIIHFLRTHFGMKYFFPHVPVPTVSMHSVAHLGLYALWLMGCSTVYLVGQDLAFDPKTRLAHVEGHPYEKEEQPWYGIQAEGHQGQKVETDVLWLEFSYSLSEIIRRYHIDCRNVIPETYGIKIPHAQRMEPGSDVFSFPETNRNIPKILKETASRGHEDAHRRHAAEFLAHAGKAVQDMENHLEAARSILSEIILFSKSPAREDPSKSEDYVHFRKQLEPKLKLLSRPGFVTPFLIGKNLDISKNMKPLPVNGTDPIDRWNYLSFLSSLMGHQIATYQLLLKDLKPVVS